MRCTGRGGRRRGELGFEVSGLKPWRSWRVVASKGKEEETKVRDEHWRTKRWEDKSLTRIDRVIVEGAESGAGDFADSGKRMVEGEEKMSLEVEVGALGVEL